MVLFAIFHRRYSWEKMTDEEEFHSNKKKEE